MPDSFEYYRSILKEELVPALGCTEPIALAYGAAYCRSVLGSIPESIEVLCSSNIIKNVKSVSVPNCNGLKGIEAAVTVGALYGNASLDLEVLKDVKENDVAEAIRYMYSHSIKVLPLKSESKLHFIIHLFSSGRSASVEIKDSHTNVVCVIKNGNVLRTYSNANSASEREKDSIDDHKMSVESIINYAENEDIHILHSLFDVQLEDNWSIANEGLRKSWGYGIGSIVEKNSFCGSLSIVEALAAAGSDARMSGCPMPVVINSGSGNQGITVSVPVIAYAKEHDMCVDDILRALAISNLLALYQKSSIGRLSAFCGAVSAASGAGAAITWLAGGSLKQIEDTLTNSLAIISGIICDGAKPSCAGKIAVCVNAALIAHSMAMEDKSFIPGDGIVKDDVDKTVKGVGRIASIGMKETDDVILDVMLE